MNDILVSAIVSTYNAERLMVSDRRIPFLRTVFVDRLRLLEKFSWKYFCVN